MQKYIITLVNTVDGVKNDDAQRVANLLRIEEPVFFANNRAVDLFYNVNNSDLTPLMIAGAVRGLWQKGAPFDMAVQYDDGVRQKKLLLSDMDATIVCEESLDMVAEYAGCGAKVAEITQMAMRGELDFHSALAQRVMLLRDQSVDIIKMAVDNITLSDGAQLLVQQMNEWGAKTVLISGGFTMFTDTVKHLVGFGESIGNTLEIINNRLTGNVLGRIVDKFVKQKVLLQHAKQLNILTSATVAVGDGANDLLMLQSAGLGVAYRGKPLLKYNIASWIDISDLTALLYFQGKEV